jgi:hypothetical protein
MLAIHGVNQEGCPQAPKCHQGRSGSKTTDNLNRTRFIYANIQPNLGCEAHQAGEGANRGCESGGTGNDETIFMGSLRRLLLTTIPYPPSGPTWKGELRR